jgi:hypothetical protein
VGIAESTYLEDDDAVLFGQEQCGEAVTSIEFVCGLGQA